MGSIKTSYVNADTLVGSAELNVDIDGDITAHILSDPTEPELFVKGLSLRFCRRVHLLSYPSMMPYIVL